MHLLICGEKGRNDRPIEISIDGTYRNREDAVEKITDILVNWVLRDLPKDEDLLEELNYNLEDYYSTFKQRIHNEITEKFNKQENYIQIRTSDGYHVYYDKEGNPCVISTGCPIDNEYSGETYTIMEVK